MKNAPYCSFAPAHHWMNARCNSIAVSLHHLLLLLLTCAFIRHTWGVSFFSLSSRAARVDAPPIRKAASFKVDPGPEALTDWETLFLSTLSVVSWRLWQEGFHRAASRWTWKLEFPVFFFFSPPPWKVCVGVLTAAPTVMCAVVYFCSEPGTTMCSHYNFPRTEKYEFKVFRPASGKH